MNVVCLSGRLASDPEAGESSNGVNYTRFPITIEKGSSESKETMSLPCVAFRQTADFIQRCFKKGDGINLSGSLNLCDWIDDDGTRRRKFEILVSRAGFPNRADPGIKKAGATAPKWRQAGMGPEHESWRAAWATPRAARISVICRQGRSYPVNP